MYIVFSNVQSVMTLLNQKETDLTFDAGIYPKAKEIQRRLPDEFDNFILRIGGFHIIMNFVSDR